MSKIPERLDPPKDDWVECPICEGMGRVPVGEHAIYHEITIDGQEDIPELVFERYEKDWGWCPDCGGDGVIPKVEEQRELEAAQADKDYDAKRDKKMMEEE